MKELVNTELDFDIIAAISAALAFEKTKPGHKLIVKSFRRIPRTSPVWNFTGRIETIRNNLN